MKTKSTKPITISKAEGQARKAVVKFKRIQTLARKCLGLSQHSDVKINLLIYEPRFHKLIQHYTDEEVALDVVTDMMDSKANYQGRKPLQMVSKDIRDMAGIADKDQDEYPDQTTQMHEDNEVSPSLKQFELPAKRAKPSLKVNIDLPNIDLELESLKNQRIAEPKSFKIETQSPSASLSDHSVQKALTPEQAAISLMPQSLMTHTFVAPPIEPVKKVEE